MYCLYYPDEGRYSEPMLLSEANKMARMFLNAFIVDIRTGEVMN